MSNLKLNPFHYSVQGFRAARLRMLTEIFIAQLPESTIDELLGFDAAWIEEVNELERLFNLPDPRDTPPTEQTGGN